MQQRAFELIRVVELERSGIRDGAGFWYGCDPVCEITYDLHGLYREYERTSATQPPMEIMADDEISF